MQPVLLPLLLQQLPPRQVPEEQSEEEEHELPSDFFDGGGGGGGGATRLCAFSLKSFPMAKQLVGVRSSGRAVRKLLPHARERPPFGEMDRMRAFNGPKAFSQSFDRKNPSLPPLLLNL